MYNGKGSDSLEGKINLLGKEKNLIMERKLRFNKILLLSYIGKTEWSSLRSKIRKAQWVGTLNTNSKGKPIKSNFLMKMWLKVGIFYISWRINTKISEWNEN